MFSMDFLPLCDLLSVLPLALLLYLVLHLLTNCLPKDGLNTTDGMNPNNGGRDAERAPAEAEVVGKNVSLDQRVSGRRRTMANTEGLALQWRGVHYQEGSTGGRDAERAPAEAEIVRKNVSLDQRVSGRWRTMANTEGLALQWRRVQYQEGSTGRKLRSGKDFLNESIQIEKEKSNPSIYKLQLHRQKIDAHGHLQKCTLGPQKSTYNDKVIMMLGATGSGKTTLINGMANYILGVKWEDDFRFKLIDEESNRSQAESQTSSITSYRLIHQEGFQVPYNLTIIDTPGFGDTRGIDRDRFLVEQIREFFSTPGGVAHLDAVCFVVQSSLARLTHSQRYILDFILSIFGKDVADNILVLVTFADGQKPPVLSAIKVAEMPCPMDNGTPVHFKFNNSALFASNGCDESTEDAEEDDHFDKMFWTLGVNSLKKFFTSLDKLETKSLRLTKEVLKERKQLDVVVEGLQPQINAGLTKHEEIRKTKAILEQNKDKMKANENFEYEVPRTVAKKKGITDFSLTCQRCHQTCHYPCDIADDSKKYECEVMDRNKNCTVCPGRCIWSVHFNQKYKWEFVTEIEKGIYHELKENYEKARGEVMTTEGIFQQLNEELACVEVIVSKLTDELSRCLRRLEEIALKPNPLLTPQYIDLLILSEKEEAKPGYMERIKSLMDVKKQAVLITEVSKREELMPIRHVPSSSKKNTKRGLFEALFRS